MSTRLLKTMAAAALVAAAVAPSGLAAQQGTRAQPEARATAPQQEAIVRVTNNNWLDMHIYVSQEGGPLRSIGMVNSFQTAELKLPVGNSATWVPLRIVADPIGGSGIYVSPDILGGTGDEVLLTIANSLPLSWMTVRHRST